MKPLDVRSTLFAWILSAGVSILPWHIAHSQLGFGRVANLPYSGGVTVINNLRPPPGVSQTVKLGSSSISGALNASSGPKAAPVPARTVSVNISPIITSQWQAASARMIDSAMTFLDERHIGGGFRTSRNKITLAADGPMFVGWDGRGFTVRLLLSGNRVSTYLRTPTPLDRDLDPGFVVDFDLELLMDIEVRDNQLTAGPARVIPTVRRPTGKNITGDLTVALANFLQMLSGTDFTGVFLKHINSGDYPVHTGLNAELARLNPVLQAAARGGVVLPGFDAGTSSVTLTLQKAGPREVVR